MKAGYPHEVGMKVTVELIEATSRAEPGAKPAVELTVTTFVMLLFAVAHGTAARSGCFLLFAAGLRQTLTSPMLVFVL